MERSIPKNQGNWVQVCVNSGLSTETCHTYESTGSDMSVSLPAGIVSCQYRICQYRQQAN
jgi:hypothetical protein